MTIRVYRVQDANSDAATLLDEQTWQSRVWSGMAYRSCPQCKGYPLDEVCETCGDAGEVEDVRHGVSACRSLDDLYRYFGRRMGPDTITAEQLAGCVLVEMDAEVATDDDHDETEGLSVLVWPQRIISVRPFNAAEIPAELVAE